MPPETADSNILQLKQFFLFEWIYTGCFFMFLAMKTKCILSSEKNEVYIQTSAVSCNWFW